MSSSGSAGVSASKGSAGAAAASGKGGTPASAGAGAAAAVAPQAGSAGVAHAGTGAAGMSGAGAAAAGKPADMDSDAGVDSDTPKMGSATDITIVAQAAFAMTAPALTIEGASCAAGSCTIAPPADGKLKVALVLEHNGSSDPMPVLARWTGCGTPTTTFFPQTPSGTSYVINYESQFSDLHAGSTCSAEIVQGSWLVFAGNMSLEVTAGKDFCSVLQVSEMGLNASCFPPPGTKVTVESDLPRWDCANIAADGMAKDMTYTDKMLTLTSEMNQLVSCMGIAQ